MKQYDVIVVGASFAGLACAKRAAQRGLSVAILERKQNLQRSIHTTGILVQEAADIIQPPDHLVNKINKVRIYAPSLKFIEMKSDNYFFYATNTPALLNYLAEDAKKNNIDIFLDTPFRTAKKINNDYIINNHFSCRFIVGADGAKSTVASYFNLGINKKFLVGTEVEYTGVSLAESDMFYCFFDQKLAPGYIGWAVPSVGITQVGIAVNQSQKSDIKLFWQNISSQFSLSNPKIVDRRGGLIPISGLVQPFSQDNIILTGDAAGIVSPLTGGGIHTAAFYGQRLGDLIANHLFNNDQHPSFFLKREYPRFYFKHYIRKIYDRLPNSCFKLLLTMPKFELIAKNFFFLRKRLKDFLS